MDELLQFKLLSTLAIWCLAMGGGFLPLYIHKINRHVTSVLNMCAAGIFLSASLVHMLPDAVKNQTLQDLEVLAHFIQDSSHTHENEHLPLIVNTAHKPPDSKDDCVAVEVTHAHIHGLIDTSANPLLAFVVFAALSFHSLIEGVGIGAASSYAWNILLAIVAHKSLAAMALCLELLNHSVERSRILWSIFLFAAMSPVGVGIGTLLVGSDPSESVASGICTALAGGTFLYVGAMEIIPQELHDRKHLSSKCLALLASFITFSVLAIWV